jgi:hypothetical protein
MTTKIGVGYADTEDSVAAGREAASAALAHASLKSGEPQIALIFTTSKHDPKKIREGVRSAIGSNAKLIGGYGVGVITNDKLGYEGYQVGVAVMSSSTIKFDMFIENGLADNEEAVGKRLAKQIRGKDFVGEPTLWLMYDSIKKEVASGFSLNMGLPLLQGMQSELKTWPSSCGIGLLGDMQFRHTWQWFDDNVVQNTAMCLAMHGGVQLNTTIMHGCKPSGGYRKITKAEGPWIYEIDGRPALEMISEMMGESDTGWDDYPLFITLGVNRGDKFGAFREEEYANRLCVGIDKEKKGMLMLEPDLVTGTEIQLMRRSIDFDYMEGRVKAAFDALGNRKPVFAFYIDCAGRAGAYSGLEREDAQVLQSIIGNRVPLLGMYSGVEIAKVGTQDMQVLDWTGILCIWSEPS